MIDFERILRRETRHGMLSMDVVARYRCRSSAGQPQPQRMQLRLRLRLQPFKQGLETPFQRLDSSGAVSRGLLRPGTRVVCLAWDYCTWQPFQYECTVRLSDTIEEYTYCGRTDLRPRDLTDLADARFPGLNRGILLRLLASGNHQAQHSVEVYRVRVHVHAGT